jgi:hypothetical protein
LLRYQLQSARTEAEKMPRADLSGQQNESVYIPVATDAGFGLIFSFGADGRKGGQGYNADLEAKFGR